MAVPEVFFVNVNLREGINTDQITSARRKLVSGEAFSLFKLMIKMIAYLIVSRSVLFLAFVALCSICCVTLYSGVLVLPFMCPSLFWHV